MNPLQAQVQALPDLIRRCSDRVEAQARRLLSTPELVGLRQVVLTGCGDSHIAARAASFVWHELSGVPATAWDAMSLARFHGRYDTAGRPGERLVLAISSSGNVARVVEATRQVHGPATIVCAVTANRTGRLAGAADRVLDVAADVDATGPGVCSYVMSLLGAYHLAIRAGEVRGRYTMDEAARLRGELGRLGDAVEATVAVAAGPVAELVDQWAGYETVELLGAGPERASAAYGSAKLLEAAGLRAVDQDVEEFLHLNYFARDPAAIATLAVDPSTSPAASRVAELLPYLRQLGRPLAVLTDRPGPDLTLPYAAGHPLFLPVVHAAVFAMLAGLVMEQRGETPGRGASGPWAGSQGGRAVSDSQIEVTHDP